MTTGEKISAEAKFLIREYALRVARKKHPGAKIEVKVDDGIDADGRVKRTVRIVPQKSQVEEAGATGN